MSAPRMSRSAIIACMDAIALEIASKIADYKALESRLELLRREVAPYEDRPPYVDTHELIGNAFTRRRRVS